MRNNKIFALVFRCAAFILCLTGILKTAGVFDGRLNAEIFLYYTVESNILVLVTFGIFIAKTAADLRRGGGSKSGVSGGAGYYERYAAVVTLAITVTMLIFWVMLAPVMEPAYLLAYSNLQVHTFTPLLMIFDYFLFAAPGRMKKADPWIFAAIPFAYFIQSTILGFAGVRYHAFSKTPTRFPYFFVDFDLSGAWVFFYVALFTVFFMGLAYLLLWFDGKRRRG
ncbi:MAG: hypothetical protein LBS62_13820 [Clostridiales bacterium]|jgi:hypothetical protein|nr:hypothetical protein [Clostridiales bacterium]